MCKLQYYLFKGEINSRNGSCGNASELAVKMEQIP